MTLITLTQGTDRAYYTSYRMGSVIAVGSFKWTTGTGACSAFGAY